MVPRLKVIIRSRKTAVKRKHHKAKFKTPLKRIEKIIIKRIRRNTGQSLSEAPLYVLYRLGVFWTVLLQGGILLICVDRGAICKTRARMNIDPACVLHARENPKVYQRKKKENENLHRKRKLRGKNSIET